MSEYVLVVGATLLDVKGKPEAGLAPGTSNPASIRSTRGGTARNVAENLARLGAKARLISAVGDDATGRQLLRSTADAGVDVGGVLRLPGQRTGTYIALLEADGTLSVALDDVSVMKRITAAHLYQHRKLFRDAALVFVDGSLAETALETAVRLCRQYGVPLCADPSSARLVDKLRPHLDALRLAVPNEVEAAALCRCDFEGYDPEGSLSVARDLVKWGVDIAVVTLSDFGLVYATSDETGHIPPQHSTMVDSTGTGDAVTAAIIVGLLNELAVGEAIRLGAAAAALTVQTSETVVENLSLDTLYDHLVV